MSEGCHAAVGQFANLLDERYVDATRGSAAAAAVKTHERNGRYTALPAPDLAEALTTDVRGVTNDLHVRVEFRVETKPPHPAMSPEALAEVKLFDPSRNFGLEKVERLPGNIGLLQLTFLAPPPDGCRVIAHAMELLRYSDALVLDLVRCTGGDPTTIAFLLSYLLAPGPRRLFEIYRRDGDRRDEFWSVPYLPTARYGDERPVIVAMGRGTASGAEGMSQVLRELGRATLVGETTVGAAHIVGQFPLAGGLVATISTGRAITLTEDGNWEGRGVAPDVAATAETAAQTAHRTAVGVLLETLGSDSITSPRLAEYLQVLDGAWRGQTQSVVRRRSASGSEREHIPTGTGSPNRRVRHAHLSPGPCDGTEKG